MIGPSQPGIGPILANIGMNPGPLSKITCCSFSNTPQEKISPYHAERVDFGLISAINIGIMKM